MVHHGLTDGIRHACLIVHDALQGSGHHDITCHHREFLRAHQWIDDPTVANTIELYRFPHPTWIRNRTRATVRLRWLQSKSMAFQTTKWK